MPLLLLLSILSSSAFAQIGVECDETEKVIEQKFILSPFGKAAWNINISEASEVIAAVEQIKLAHPDKTVTRNEVLVCASDFPVPPLSLTDKKEGISMDLAMKRAANLKKEFNAKKIPSDISQKLCGPEYRESDKNYRFKVKGLSGTEYDKAYVEISKTEGILEQYKNEALIEDFAQVKEKFPEPYLAKYKPFQGYRLKVYGNDVCKKEKKDLPKKSSGKNQ